MNIQCPDCSVPLTIAYGSLSCPQCALTGDAAFWSDWIRHSAMRPTKTCPFCSGRVRRDSSCGFECGECGIPYNDVVAARLSRMSPYYRENFIGTYHAENGHPYHWMHQPQTREEERGYARGWMTAPLRNNAAIVNRRLWDKEAARDASMWR
jgi:hypothetical protein